ncbi:MAG: hypothetical protein E4H01_15555 [Lysobacterales bacterium]|nr:MAG: hypothetical protein E4H01_15555 [Xanthomonadales bacterium]
MALYNRWMNERLYAVCVEIPDGERKQTDTEILDFSESLDEAGLAREFRFTTIVNPAEHACAFRHVLLHFFNHQTHHRGQLTTPIKQAGYEPGVTDLMWLPGVRQ